MHLIYLWRNWLEAKSLHGVRRRSRAVLLLAARRCCGLPTAGCSVAAQTADRQLVGGALQPVAVALASVLAVGLRQFFDCAAGRLRAAPAASAVQRADESGEMMPGEILHCRAAHQIDGAALDPERGLPQHRLILRCQMHVRRGVQHAAKC